MGWTGILYQKGQPMIDFFRQEFEHERGKILDCAVVHRTEAYIAYQYSYPDNERPPFVFCLTVMLRFTRCGWHGYGTELTYKEVDETMGPYICNCPERILRLLSPLDMVADPNTDPYRWARRWRQECWKQVNRSKAWRKLQVGDILRLRNPVRFTDGITRDLMLLQSKKPLRIRSVWENPGNEFALGSYLGIKRRTITGYGFDVVGKMDQNDIITMIV